MVDLFGGAVDELNAEVQAEVQKELEALRIEAAGWKFLTLARELQDVGRWDDFVVHNSEVVDRLRKRLEAAG